MKMNKIGSVVKFTLEKNIRNKWFIGLNILLFVIMLVFFNFSYIKEIFKENNIIKSEDEIVIKLKDETGFVFEDLNNKIENGTLKGVRIEEVEDISYDNNLDKNTIILYVMEDNEKLLKTQIISKEGINTKYYDPIYNSLESSRNKIFSGKYNIEEKELNKLNEEISVDRIMVSVDNTNSDTKEMLKLGFNYLVFLILLMVLSKVANEISQEKISKSIEYVLTCITEKEYLIAKVISINLMLILQAVFTVIYFYVSLSISSIFKSAEAFSTVTSNGMSDTVLNTILDPTLLLYVVLTFVFMILTVIVLCLIQAALSAKTTNISEAGNATVILVVLNLVVYTLTTFLISPVKEPSILMYIFSCIPVVSMYFIPAMILVGQANVFQIILAIILNIIAVPLALRFSSKMFKEGVLGNTNVKKENKKIEKEDINVKNSKIFEKEKYSKFGFVIGMSLILYVFLNIILMLIFNMFVPIIASKFNISLINANLIIQMIVFALTLYIPYLFINWYSKENDIVFSKKKKIDVKEVLKSVLMAIPIICLIQIGSSYILGALNQNYDILDKITLYDENSIFSKILMIIYVGVLPAIFEELFFRKGIIKYSSKISKTFAIFASALIFSVIHLNISQSFAAFFMGLLFAYIAIKNDSIIPTIILHFLNNTFAILLEMFGSNNVLCNSLYIILIALVIIGIIFIILELIKNRKSLKEKYTKILKADKRNNEEIIKNKYMYILKDYVFVVALIVILVMYIATQKLLMM